MSATHKEPPRHSLADGDLEKNQYREDVRQAHADDDHETSSDIHSDRDASTIGDHDDAADAQEDPSGLFQPVTQPITREKTRRSNDLRRPASNVLSAIASRISTRGWPEPPPPPDGGFQAWLQVGCVRIFFCSILG